MGLAGTAVILQWAKLWVGVNQVTTGRETACIAAVQVVTIRYDRAEAVSSRSTAGNNDVPQRGRHLAIDAAAAIGCVGKESTIGDGYCADVVDATTFAVCAIAGESAIDDGH